MTQESLLLHQPHRGRDLIKEEDKHVNKNVTKQSQEEDDAIFPAAISPSLQHHRKLSYLCTSANHC